jgi:CubicO group peptidase (beta-lactamase class C family)
LTRIASTRAGAKGWRRAAPIITLAGVLLVAAAAMAQTPSSQPTLAPDIEARIQALVPDLERYLETGMAGFDVPGAAVGIVAGDRLVYSRGFGLRRKGGDEPVDAKTVFQIGSMTKAFLATTLAIAVDRGKLKWGERVVELDPSFTLKDPYVTREFRVFDLLAQRSGLPPQANTILSLLGFNADWLMHSLRFVEPRTSFRSTFSYINITHLFAGRIVVQALGTADWAALARREILEPLDMRDTSFTAEAIANAPDHAVGHRWSAKGSVEIPFEPSFPYVFGGRRHQFDARGLRALAAATDRRWRFRGASAGLAEEPRGDAHAEDRDQRDLQLCDGLDHQRYTERPCRLARWRHQRVRHSDRLSAERKGRDYLIVQRGEHGL